MAVDYSGVQMSLQPKLSGRAEKIPRCGRGRGSRPRVLSTGINSWYRRYGQEESWGIKPTSWWEDRILRKGYDLWKHESVRVGSDIVVRILLAFSVTTERGRLVERDFLHLTVDVDHAYRETYRWRAERRYLIEGSEEEQEDKMKREWAFGESMERASCVPVDIFPNPDKFIEAIQVENERRRLAELERLREEGLLIPLPH